MTEQSKGVAMRTGLVVMISLAVLTGAEFAASVLTDGSVVPLAIIALIKAGLIIQYFMHSARVLGYGNRQGGDHS